MPSSDTDTKTAADPPPDRKAAFAFAGVIVAIAAFVGIVLLVSGGGGDEGEGDESATAAAIECEAVPDDGGSEECPEEVVTDPANVVVSTSEGDFEIALDVEASPATTTSFRMLVESGFYDGLNFNRVVDGFVIQGGDPLADDAQLAGSGGPGYYVDEPVPEGTEYTEGVVAMAKTAVDPSGRSGSQFFVVSGQDTGLPPDYAYLGTVASGLDTVKRIESLGVADGPPRKEVTIESMTVAPPSGP